MKKIFLMIMAIVLIGNCAILNPIGLNSGRIKGDEAKSKIQETAILNDVLLSTAFFGSPTVRACLKRDQVFGSVVRNI